MFFKMLAFEWRYYTKQPSFYVTGLVFFLLPFLAMVSDNVQIGGGGNILFNSAFAIAQTMLILGIFSMFLVVNFAASTAIRNDETKMSEILYSKPLKPIAYQLGRFVGAYLVILVIFAMVPLGTLAGSVMPWLDSERLGPTNLSFYFTTYAYFSAPTLFVFTSLFYAAAAKFRSLMSVYLVAIALFFLYVLSGSLLGEPEYRTISALSDPFGLRTYGDITRYWSVFEKNTQTITFSGTVLYNRVIWVSLGVIVLALFGGLHRYPNLARAKKSKKAAAEKSAPISLPELSAVLVKSNAASFVKQLATRTKFEIKQVMFSPAFLILLLFSAINLIAILLSDTALYGTSNWPLTQSMLNYIEGTMQLMILIVITYYSGEIVWRERNSGMGDIVDSLPVFNLTFWVSKITSMWLVLLSISVMSATITIAFQMIKGFAQIDIAQYVTHLLFFTTLPWGLLAILAFFIQVLSPNKFVGMLIFIVYIVAQLTFSQLGLEHNMFTFAGAPALQYSDMNRFGFFIQTQTWYMVYWGGLALALSVIGYGMWQRGPQVSLKSRFAQLSYHMGAKGKLTLASGLLVFIFAGGYIYYNTTVVNTFITNNQREDLLEEYEKKYAQFRDDPIPVITKVDIEADIYPKIRMLNATAHIEVINKFAEPISRFLVAIPSNTPEWSVEIEGGKITQVDKPLRQAWFEFDKPMQPGETRTGKLFVSRQHHGFKDNNFDWTLLENGTFINNGELLPNFGFDETIVLSDRHERRKRGLPEPKRANDLDDSRYYNQNFFGPAGDAIDFEATLSTSEDQIAIAPGYLQEEWVENGRRYFHYKMDSPMFNFFSILSARLAVKKDTHNGVAIEVYYHPTHGMNVDIMVQSVKDSIDYFTEAFGPYQHKQMRIIEFPGYRSFAQSFANTVPYSEQIGFISDLRDPEKIDPVYYVTAHEVAHQWWGHQVGAANVQGNGIIVESLSQYSALSVMEKKYGTPKLRNFLTYELDRYLGGRSQEQLKELPFMRSENQQYIHYRKGSVVTMSVRDKLGEDRMNQALRTFLQTYKFKNDPYPTTRNLMAALQSVATNEEERAFIESQFSQILLYDLRTKDVQVTELDSGQFEVTLTVLAERYEADEQGQETQIDLNESIDIALFNQDPDDLTAQAGIIYMQPHAIVSGENTITLVVDEQPTYAGVDPFVKLIDRDTKDNIKKL